MILAGGLGLYALVLGISAPRHLSTAAWVQARPRLGLLAWHAVATSTLTALLAGMVIAAHDVSEHLFVSVFSADKHAIHHAYTWGLPPAWWWNYFALLPAAMMLYVAIVSVRAAGDLREQLERHARLLRTGWPHPHLADVHVVDHAERFLYCLPSRRGRPIVMSSAAQAALEPAGLHAAVEHERAHLRRLHHLHHALAAVLTAALRPTGMLRAYGRAVHVLCEMDADDHAASSTDRVTVARALLDIASGPGPAGTATLGMAAADTSARIRRLLDVTHRTTPVPRTCAPAVTVASLALVALPLISSSLPAAMLWGTR